MGERALKRALAAPGAPAVVALAAAYLLAAWGFALPMPFISDDWQILARVRAAGFGDLWGGYDLLWRWWRPWSRELHFWTLFRAAGANPIVFHAASFALWLAVIALAHALARRAAGTRIAALACAGWITLAAWSGALLWAAGVQDLWMLAGVFAFVLAFASRRTLPALAALAVALLSKETAVVSPGLVLAWAWYVDRDPLRAAMRRAAPYALLCAAWFVLHPTLRDRLFDPARLGVELATHTAPAATVALRTLALPFNLEVVPHPVGGVAAALVPALPAIALAVALAAWAAFARAGAGPRASARRERARGATDAAMPPAPRVAALGAAWALIAWLPLAMPSIDWHPYYALLGAFGAWLVLAAGLTSAPRLAVAVVLAVATLAPLQGATAVESFSASLYQRRQAYFVGRLRADLLRLHPRVPSHARLYFSRVPNSIGLGYAWFRPAFQVWYGDSTVAGGFWSAYAPRPAGAPRGPDLFFRYDSVAVGWVEVSRGLDDSATRAANPLWRDDHRALAAQFVRSGDWPAAAATFEALHAAYPDSAEFVYDAGLAYEMAGDSARAARAYAAVAAAPGATPDQRAFAARFAARRRAR